ncbi:MAG: hypothetical protein ABEJ87_05570 [Candidatus Nanohalobium sp.]
MEVYADEPVFERQEIDYLGGRKYEPGPEAYEDEEGGFPGFEGACRKGLEGETVVLAFGFRGENLPTYLEADREQMRDNCWENFSELDVDVLADDKSYYGAINSTGGFVDSYWMSEGDVDRRVYLLE